MVKTPLWSSRSLGNRPQHNFFYLLVQLRLLWLARFFVYLVVLWYTAKPSVRERSKPYLRRMFPGSRRWRQFIHSYNLNLNFAFSLLDKTVVGITGEVHQINSVEPLATMQQVLAEGQGLILLTAHFGSMQSGMAELKNLNTTVNICLYKDNQDIDLHYFEHDNKNRMNIIYADQPFGGVVEMLAALQRGEIICFVGDRRLYASDPALSVKFLGDDALFPYMPYVLAAKTQCPVAVFFLPRMGHGVFELHLADIFKVAAVQKGDVQGYQQPLNLYVKYLEEIIKKFPYQFFTFFDMWSNESNDNSRAVKANSN